MQSEHVFQIAVSVDDDAIQAAALKAASDATVKAATEAFMRRSYHGRQDWELNDNGERILSKAISDLVDANKDMIISTVVNNITEKLFRSKSMKEKIGEIVNDK